jgi:hypothetical protein
VSYDLIQYVRIDVFGVQSRVQTDAFGIGYCESLLTPGFAPWQTTKRASKLNITAARHLTIGALDREARLF